MNTTTKRTMHNPAKFVGKRIDITKWNSIDPWEDYVICRWTGKLMHADNTVSFNHYAFDRDFLTKHGLMVECAEWLSEEGYDLLIWELEKVLTKMGIDADALEVAYGDVYVEGVSDYSYYIASKPWLAA